MLLCLCRLLRILAVISLLPFIILELFLHETLTLLEKYIMLWSLHMEAPHFPIIYKYVAKDRLQDPRQRIRYWVRESKYYIKTF
jgi:hypothetical protein